jgi:hypothetical protein
LLLGGNLEHRYAGDEGGAAEAEGGGGAAGAREEEGVRRRGPHVRELQDAQGGQSRGRGPLRNSARHALPQAKGTYLYLPASQ